MKIKVQPMAKQPPENKLKHRLLEAALPDVPFDGWSDALLDHAARRLNISEDAAREAFPQGALSLVRYFSEWADEKMLQRLTPAELRDLKIREKIPLGVRSRLEILTPLRPAVSSSLAYLALPPR